jgi:cytochrome c oxidase subunit 1
MLGLNGLSAILASLGGIIFVVVIVGSILFGKRKDEVPARASAPVPPPQAAAVASYGNAGTLHLPGTAVLVTIFFSAFVLYYYVNWKYLAEVWPLR